MAVNVFESLRSTYGDLLTEAKAKRLVQKSASENRMQQFSRALAASAGGPGTNIVPQYQIQQVLRPLYGKHGRNPSSIGDHPDFEHLRHTDDVEYHPITTLFMDIESSTRLGLLFDLPTVFRIKNTFILAATEIIKAFDGHVHRIMGDAVMAYFGQRNGQPEDGVIDALNCASMLMLFVKQSVIPKLNEETPGADFGIRIGLDHGQREDVLWSCYGYPDMCEVTATSFYVDVAAKLQHAAGRNQIMLGESLRAAFDLHDELIGIKTCVREGKTYSEPFISPNHTNRDGEKINYRQHLFDAEKYFTLSPLAASTSEIIPALLPTNIAPVQVKATLHRNRQEPKIADVITCGTAVPKGHEIRFAVVPPSNVRFPCTVKFKVENHGNDARNHGGESYGNHELDLEAKSVLELAMLFNWESTAYHGLHYMVVEVRSGGLLTHRGRFGVYIR